MTNLSDYDYELPETSIASYPCTDRPHSKLLKYSKEKNEITHHHFYDLEEMLEAGDVLVLNNTKVIPARLLGKRDTGGQLEVLLLTPHSDRKWCALVCPSGRVKKGTILTFGRAVDLLRIKVLNDPQEGSGEREIELLGESPLDKIEKLGHMPLPPYIRRPDEDSDKSSYQTVFAKERGAVAAPTAGLHFNEKLIERLQDKGVQIAPITLHVSYGTFQPVQEEDITKHKMFEEVYSICDESARLVNKAVAENRRVIACGTTSVRTLESAVNDEGFVEAGQNKTRLFIYPPYKFRIVNGLITNFHLPGSSLLMLVAAFIGGRDKLFDIYNEAIQQKYRFYSYGDAMVVF